VNPLDRLLRDLVVLHLEKYMKDVMDFERHVSYIFIYRSMHYKLPLSDCSGADFNKRLSCVKRLIFLMHVRRRLCEGQ
jgi:hypothetical protein